MLVRRKGQPVPIVLPLSGEEVGSGLFVRIRKKDKPGMFAKSRQTGGERTRAP